MPYLTPEQKATLAEELAKPQYAGLSDAAAAALLNAAPATGGPTTRKRVSMTALLTRVHELGLMHPLRVKRTATVLAASDARTQGETATATNLDALVALMDVALDYFQNTHITDVDMDRAAFRAMLAGIKQLGVINDTTEAAILALGDVPGVTTYGPTPFQALFGGTRFETTAGEGPLAITTAVSGTCLPEMVAEARS